MRFLKTRRTVASRKVVIVPIGATEQRAICPRWSRSLVETIALRAAEALSPRRRC